MLIGPENFDNGVREVAKYLGQETAADRGLNTCYPTSILNAAIGLGLVSLQEAAHIHEPIITDLGRIPDLWNGSVMRIDSLDSRIAEVIEGYLPQVRVGFDDPASRRLMTVPRTYDAIWADLASSTQTHVIVVEQGFHAYAAIGVNEAGVFGYVDPSFPKARVFANREYFNKVFRPNSRGEVTVTPVRANTVRIL